MPVIAAVMPAPRVPVELRELPEPSLEPGSASRRTLYSEVCGEIRGCRDSEVGHFVRLLERHHATIRRPAIGAKTDTLAELNQALAVAEAMRLPKALVKPA
jgi:hypothetical protein